MTLIFFVVVGAMWLGALLFVDLSLQTPFSTLAERLQLTRSAWLLNLLGLIYLTRLLVVGWRAGRLPKPLALLLVAAMLEAPPDWNHLDPLLLAGWVLLLAQQLGRRPLLDRLGTWGPWALALLGGLAGAAHLELKELDFGLSLRTTIVFGGLALGWGLYEALTRRGVDARRAAPALALGLLCAVGVRQADNWSYANAHKGGLKAAADFQDWARTKTPLDSVFLILPSEPNNQDFYRRAERALYLARDRSQWIVYFREQAFEFQRRVQAFGIDQPARYRDDLDNAYRRLTEDQVRQLARDFGVTHFVPARAGSYSFPIVYQSGGWTVYDVR
jgi:hypothetical protein